MKRLLLIGFAIVALAQTSTAYWVAQPEVSRITVDPSNLPTALQLRDTRIRVTTAAGVVVDLVPLINENPPDVTVYVPISDLGWTSIFTAYDDVIQGDPVLAIYFTGRPGLNLHDNLSGPAPNIRRIGGNNKIGVQTVQEGSY